MQKADVCWLIEESVLNHGVFAAPTATERMVYCTVRSVGMRENYAAASVGLLPELSFVLALADDYSGEKYLRYNGTVYMVIRVYYNDNGGVELTVQRSDMNANL